MCELDLPTDEQVQDLFDVRPEDAGLSLSVEPDLEAVERKTVREVQNSLRDWAENTRHTESLYPKFAEQFASCIARSKQFDDKIGEYRELCAEISLNYMEQSTTLWAQMRRLTEKEDRADE